MIRRTLVLVSIAAVLGTTAAHAEGGDILVVTPDTKEAAQATNTEADDALHKNNRGLLSRMVAFGCTRKARNMPEFITLSEQHGGKDIAKPYCQCFASGIVDKLNAGNIKTMIQTQQADPELQAQMMPVAASCMEQASR